MGQNPTSDSQPKGELVKFSGLNDQQDSVYRPEGTITNGQNVYDRFSKDACRREGRDFDRLEASSINSIFQFTWADGGVSLFTDAGGTWNYDAFTYPNPGALNLTNPSSPGPMPTDPSYLFSSINAAEIPDLVPVFRAVSEARQFVNNGTDDILWDSQIWAFDFYDGEGNAVATNVRTKPLFLDLHQRGFYPRKNGSYPVVSYSIPMTGTPLDFYWVDYVASKQLIIDHLNVIIDKYNNANVFTEYLKTSPIEGSTTLEDWDPSADRFTETATNANWKGVWQRLVNAINQKLRRVQVVGTQNAVAGRSVADISASPLARFADSVACLQTKLPGTYGKVERWNSATSCSFESSADLSPIRVPAWTIAKAYYFNVSGTSEFYNYKGTLGCNLSSYNANNVTEASVYVKLAPIDACVINGNFSGGGITVTFGQTRPTSVGSLEWGKVNAISSESITVGSVWTSDTIAESDDTPVPNPIASNGAYGWEVSEVVVILERKVSFPAYVAKRPQLQTAIPQEYFTKSEDQTASGETNITWDMVRTTSAGGADPSYPAPASNGSAVATASSVNLQYSSLSPGFNKSRFLGYYRPTILLRLSLMTTALSGSPASLTVKLYINNTVVQTIAGVALTNVILYWAFSIKDVGEFTDNRPPQNNPADNLNGWTSPVVKISVTPNTGTVSIGAATTLYDVVLNYPV